LKLPFFGILSASFIDGLDEILVIVNPVLEKEIRY
jgi:hypothetical protein